MAMITGNAQTVARYIALPLTALSSLQGHWQPVPRPQGDETSGFYGMASLETQPIALSDRCKNQNRFRQCKGRANANALTRSERNVGEPWGLGGKSVWVETIRLIPGRLLGVYKPGHDQNNGPRRNAMTKYVIGGDGFTRHSVCRRIKPHRFLDHHSRVAQVGYVFILRCPAIKHRSQFLM